MSVRIKLLCFLLVLPPCVFATESAAESDVVPIVLDPAIRQDASRYGFRAYAYAIDGTNVTQCLLSSPKPVGRAKLPLIVYFPGRGERGNVAKQFRQRILFDRVLDKGFQEKYPCYLLAISPPESVTTLHGGMPGHPSAMQRMVHDLIFAVVRIASNPSIDANRIYLTGFSYGGNAVYALAFHYPGEFAAALPIAALPPLAEYFDKTHPGNWWHFHNDGDYTRNDIGMRELESFCDNVNSAGGDFRIGVYPELGHNAWSKAWREDEAWMWMFSKSLAGVAKPITSNARQLAGASISFVGAESSASVEGRDAGSGPERVLDGLENTAYCPSRALEKGDWWMVHLANPVVGRVKIVSGLHDGSLKLKSAFVEISSDGRRWRKISAFSPKTGICRFSASSSFAWIRVKCGGAKPQKAVLRRLIITPKEK